MNFDFFNSYQKGGFEGIWHPRSILSLPTGLEILIDYRVVESVYVYQDYELHTRTLMFMFKKVFQIVRYAMQASSEHILMCVGLTKRKLFPINFRRLLTFQVFLMSLILFDVVLEKLFHTVFTLLFHCSM